VLKQAHAPSKLGRLPSEAICHWCWSVIPGWPLMHELFVQAQVHAHNYRLGWLLRDLNN